MALIQPTVFKKFVTYLAKSYKCFSDTIGDDDRSYDSVLYKLGCLKGQALGAAGCKNGLLPTNGYTGVFSLVQTLTPTLRVDTLNQFFIYKGYPGIITAKSGYIVGRDSQGDDPQDNRFRGFGGYGAIRDTYTLPNSSIYCFAGTAYFHASDIRAVYDSQRKTFYAKAFRLYSTSGFLSVGTAPAQISEDALKSYFVERADRFDPEFPLSELLPIARGIVYAENQNADPKLSTSIGIKNLVELCSGPPRNSDVFTNNVVLNIIRSGKKIKLASELAQCYKPAIDALMNHISSRTNNSLDIFKYIYKNEIVIEEPGVYEKFRELYRNLYSRSLPVRVGYKPGNAAWQINRNALTGNSKKVIVKARSSVSGLSLTLSFMVNPAFCLGIKTDDPPDKLLNDQNYEFHLESPVNWPNSGYVYWFNHSGSTFYTNQYEIDQNSRSVIHISGNSAQNYPPYFTEVGVKETVTIPLGDVSNGREIEVNIPETPYRLIEVSVSPSDLGSGGYISVWVV